MAEYKLTYFDARARGELIRLLFKLGGKKFEDNRVKFEDWPKMKSTLPLAQLPILEVKGKTIYQSMAIARYIARELKLSGSNSMDQAVCDMICEIQVELFNEISKVQFGPSQEVKDAAKEKVLGLIAPANKILDGNKKGKFILGDKPSLADAAIYSIREFAQSAAGITMDGTVAQIADDFAKVPQIAEWIKTRPENPF